MPALTVIDRVVSSYIPTIRALRPLAVPAAHPEQPGGSDGRLPAQGRVPAVATPHTPAEGICPAPRKRPPACGADFRPGHRTQRARRHPRHGARPATRPPGGRISPATGSATWSTRRPAACSCTIIKPWPLTVIDVARLDLDDADLAFLSACSTAQPGTRLTDEAIQLAAAFQLAGYRHVIGTLWPVGDQQAVDHADAIYATITKTGDPALAVHADVRHLRNRYARQPSAWASHIHVGA